MEDTVDIPEQVQAEIPPQQDPPNKKLYDGLVQEKLYTKSYDDFKKQFNNTESIAKLHQGLSEEKLYTKGVDDFTTQYFSDVKKKATSSVIVNPSESGLSNTQTVEPDSNYSFDRVLEKTGITKAEPIQEQPFRKDLLPVIKNYAVKDNTNNVSPNITADHIDYVQHNEERKQKHSDLVEKGIENTAIKYLKNQGVIVTDDDKKGVAAKSFVQGKPFGEAEIVSKNSSIFNKTKEKYREAYQNGNATFAIGKDGDVGLKRTIGAIEGLSKGWNNATEEADFNNNFIHNMNDEERVASLDERISNEKPTEYLGDRGSTAGSIAQWGAEQAPFLAKAGMGYGLGAVMAAAAPETGGLSLAGLPTAMSFIATAQDMANGGAASEVQRRYAILRRDAPGGNKIEQMNEAYKGGLVGGVAGIATNALLMHSGGDVATDIIKQGVSNEGKSVIKNTLKNIYKSSVHMGNVGAGIEGTKQAIGAMEGVHTIPSEVAGDMANAWGENAKTGALLSGVMGIAGALPKVLVSSFKYALKDTPSKAIETTLKFNEENGNTPKGSTQKVMADLDSYNQALAQVPKGLSLEAQASMAGLIEKQTKLSKELKSKHKVANSDLEIQIKSIDEQITKINETGKPFNAEIDEMSGEKYSQRKPEEITEPIELNPNDTSGKAIEPIQTINEQSEGQGTEKTVQQNTDGTGQGEPKPANAVLETSNSVDAPLDKENDNSVGEVEPYVDKFKRLTNENSETNKKRQNLLSNMKEMPAEEIKRVSDEITKESEEFVKGMEELSSRKKDQPQSVSTPKPDAPLVGKEEVIKLEQQRDAEIEKVSKPIINESDYRVTSNDIKNSKIPPIKEAIAKYKQDYKALKRLKALIECL